MEKNLDYNLADGDKTLLEAQAVQRTMFFQADFENVVAADVTVELWVSAKADGKFLKIAEATKTLIPADNSLYMLIDGAGYSFVQFRLKKGSATAGKVTKVYLKQ